MVIAVISMIREPWGGSEELWYEMGKHALKNGHQLLHFGYDVGQDHSKTKELIRMGMMEFKCPSLKKRKGSFLKYLLYRSRFFIEKRTNKALEQIFEYRPDVVIYNGTCYSIHEENKLMHLLSIHPESKFFYLGHLNDPRGSGLNQNQVQLVLKAYQRAEKVLFVSEHSRELAIKDLGQQISNAQIVKNPVNLKDISCVPFPKTNVPQLALVGNIIFDHKGQDTIVKILNKTYWKNKDWHLNIYGNGTDKDLLIKMITSLHLQDRISLHGRIENIRSLWGANHILLLPSHMEGMPLALVEAMLCARTCVITDVGGNSEWIRDKMEGFIAPTASEQDVEVALERAFSNIQDWQRLGEAAHLRALELYDKDPGKTLLRIVTSDSLGEKQKIK